MFIQPPSSPPSYILFNSAPPLEPITASLDPLGCSHTHTSPCPSHVLGPHCLSRDTSIFHSDGSRTVFLLWSKTIQDIVIREIDWPQYHVYRGVDRRPARYEDLNIEEFVYGALCQVIDGRDSKANKNTMLQHLRMLMGDACDFPCPNVRNFHGIVLSQMEMDRITWGDQDRIGELRQTHVQRGPAATSTPVNNKKRYCLPFQDGTCRATSWEHESPQGLVTHICAYCLPNTGSAFSHAEKDCIRKERAASKNAGAALGIGGLLPHCPVNSHGYLHPRGSQQWDHVPDTHTTSISDKPRRNFSQRHFDLSTINVSGQDT